MLKDGQDFVLLATNLANFLGRSNGTGFGMQAGSRPRERRHFDYPLLESVLKGGIEHENARVEHLRGEGLDYLDLSNAGIR
jgi:hypothetical protein